MKGILILVLGCSVLAASTATASAYAYDVPKVEYSIVCGDGYQPADVIIITPVYGGDSMPIGKFLAEDGFVFIFFPVEGGEDIMLGTAAELVAETTGHTLPSQHY